MQVLTGLASDTFFLRSYVTDDIAAVSGRFENGFKTLLKVVCELFDDKLDIHESQVSRDECNEYHGITVGRAARILDALDVRLTSHVDFDVESK